MKISKLSVQSIKDIKQFDKNTITMFSTINFETLNDGNCNENI